MTITQVLFSVFTLLFGFWPLFLVAPLGRRRHGNVLRAMFVVWGFWAVVRLGLVFNPQPLRTSLLIPEPWNTIFFGMAGGVLGGMLLLEGYFKRRRLHRKGEQMRTLEDLLALSPVEFEEMVAEWFRLRGFHAQRTGGRGDHGVDVVVTKGGKKWIVQCKRWRKPVRESIVRDFYGTVQHEKAVEGAIIAVSGFTRSAQAWAKGKPIRLISGEAFLALWQKARRRSRQ